MPRPCAVETHARSLQRDLGNSLEDATALRRGDSRSGLQRGPGNSLKMPRACAVETHARGYKGTHNHSSEDATALRRGDSRSQLQRAHATL